MAFSVNHNEESYTTEVNKIKEVLSRAMMKEGFITPEQHKEFIENYAILIRPPAGWGKAWDKAWGKEETGLWRIEVVRTVGIDGRKDGEISNEAEKDNRFSRLPLDEDRKEEENKKQ